MSEQPQNLEAEEAVLGALMLSAKVLDAVGPLLEPTTFYRPSHGLVYQAAVDLALAGEPVDPVTVGAALERRGELEQAGGRTRLHELASLVPATANAAHYAGLVREEWRRRELLRVLGDLGQRLGDGEAAGPLMDDAERALVDLRARVDRGRTTVVSAVEAAEWFDAKVRNPPSDEGGVPGPFRFWPRLHRSRLYVLGGTAAHGKTALAMQMLRTAAAAGTRVGYLTIEMSWQDLIDRLAAAYGVPYREAQTGRVAEPNMPAVHRLVRELVAWAEHGVDFIDDDAADAAAAFRYQRAGRYDLLIVDHLHRIEWEDRRDLERQVRGFTTLARRHEIPVLLLSQLRRTEKRPGMADFRDSAVIEQEAALAAIVWRKPEQDGQPGDDAELLVVKNRFGRTGSFPLRFRGRDVTFVEVTDEGGH